MLSTILSISDKPMTENKVTPRERARWNTSVLTYIYASYFILYLSFSIPLFFSAKSEAKAAAKAAAREEKERMKKWTQSLLSKARHSWIKSFPRHAVKLVFLLSEDSDWAHSSHQRLVAKQHDVALWCQTDLATFGLLVNARAGSWLVNMFRKLLRRLCRTCRGFTKSSPLPLPMGKNCI